MTYSRNTRDSIQGISEMRINKWFRTMQIII